MWVGLRCHQDGLVPVSGFYDGIAGMLQDRTHEFTIALLIIRDQYQGSVIINQLHHK